MILEVVKNLVKQELKLLPLKQVNHLFGKFNLDVKFVTSRMYEKLFTTYRTLMHSLLWVDDFCQEKLK